MHSQLDNGSQSQNEKIRGREPIKIHPQDAQTRKLKNGDIVEVFNKRGKCLAGVIISEEVMKGVVFLPVGAWYDPIDDGAFQQAKPQVIAQYVSMLEAQNITVTVRRSRGKDIDAACGQLANKS